MLLNMLIKLLNKHFFLFVLKLFNFLNTILLIVQSNIQPYSQSIHFHFVVKYNNSHYVVILLSRPNVNTVIAYKQCDNKAVVITQTISSITYILLESRYLKRYRPIRISLINKD